MEFGQKKMFHELDLFFGLDFFKFSGAVHKNYMANGNDLLSMRKSLGL